MIRNQKIKGTYYLEFISLYIREILYVNVNFRENLGDTHFHLPDMLKNLVSLSAILSYHSHKKRKDSLDRVLFAAELEFPKILVPRLPQHTSDVNIECAGKSVWSKQLYYLHVTSFLEH